MMSLLLHIWLHVSHKAISDLIGGEITSTSSCKEVWTCWAMFNWSHCYNYPTHFNNFCSIKFYRVLFWLNGACEYYYIFPNNLLASLCLLPTQLWRSSMLRFCWPEYFSPCMLMVRVDTPNSMCFARSTANSFFKKTYIAELFHYIYYIFACIFSDWKTISIKFLFLFL